MKIRYGLIFSWVSFWGLGAAVLSVLPLQAQQSSASSVYGYTSLNYDSATLELTGYTETDVDSDLTAYVSANVYGQLLDEGGNTIASDVSGGISSASVTLYASGIDGGMYVMKGNHFITLDQTVDVQGVQYSYGGGGSADPPLLYYDDIAGLSGFEAYSIDEPYAYPFDGYFYAPAYPTEPDVILGDTYDIVYLTASLACGDVRDQLIQEYSNYRVALNPTCSTFLNSLGPGPYTLSQLTPDEDAIYKPWAVIQNYLPGNLYAVSKMVPPPFSISSGYRNPAAQYRASAANNVSTAKQGRHMFGDAADIRTYMNTTYWDQIKQAGHALGACVEPTYISSYSHSHLDWRSLYSTPAKCGIGY